MKASAILALGTPPAAYAKWLAQLAQTGWICQGTVVRRTLRRRVGGSWVDKGPYYMWTGKRAGKTVCHALSLEQYQAAQTAIAANRSVVQALARMQTMTLKKILKTIPGVSKRK